MHHRLAPKEHHFRYGIFQFCLDLDELDTLSTRLRLFHRNRPALYRFNDRDHLPSPGSSRREEAPSPIGKRKAESGNQSQSLLTSAATQPKPHLPSPISDSLSAKATLLAWLASQGLPLPADTRVLLLTHCRVFGYIFNPVSFYFCLDAQDRPLCAVAEVGNTFGEQKPFLLGPEHFDGDGRFRRIVPKHFYVSPFFALDLAFDFKLRVPGEQLDIHIDDREGDRPVLLTALTGRRVPLTDGNLARLTLKYPLVTLRVITLIHWHALKLWWKNVPWHRKAANPHLQQGVFNPHESLRGGDTPVPASHRHH
ncbi:MAG: hypothetical protein FD161_1356 [Limisphaerales bacterium]|nr:MAG: hypothetical protein FD161_1356 [Limisphaerales bacterium]KAG0509433.1 MAG: hypothetical protein E1N63_1275 [Limisphaerales bacterium]TXT52270.1 MAG: hypothetical protein FD140_757 [Limisphaerales bacterium]